MPRIKDGITRVMEGGESLPVAQGQVRLLSTLPGRVDRGDPMNLWRCRGALLLAGPASTVSRHFRPSTCLAAGVPPELLVIWPTHPQVIFQGRDQLSPGPC